MEGGRWVAYIFRYLENVRCENAGFAKIQRINCKSGDMARIQIGLKLHKSYPCRYTVYLMPGKRILTDIYIMDGECDVIVSRVLEPWNDVLHTGRAIGDYAGLFIKGDDSEELLGSWINQQEFEQMVKNEFRETEESASDQMIETYPRLPDIPQSPYKDLVKITPQDIGRLAPEVRKLSINSFLSHSYYHYNYLMLGKIDGEDGEKTVIGVPGIFTNKEKYLANMFGFSEFVPAKSTRLLMGSFGYWILDISNV